MEYELAKELKDAGYKQVGSWWMDKNGKYCEPSMQICECVDPTLSELIEACGEFVTLLKTPNGCMANVSHTNLLTLVRY